MYPIFRGYVKVVLAVIYAINGLKDCSRRTKAIEIGKASKEVPLNPVALKIVKVGVTTQDILAFSRTQSPFSMGQGVLLILSLYRKDAF